MTNALAAAAFRDNEISPLVDRATGDGFANAGNSLDQSATQPLVLVTGSAKEAETETTPPPAPKKTRSKSSKADSNPDSSSELVYRFPYNRSGIELVPDIKGSFCVRVLWHRGKTLLTLAESTPLRPLGRVTMNSQRYDIFFTQHARKKRERILLAGRRKVALRASRAALRYLVSVTGREDRYNWHWRIGANAAALGITPNAGEAESLVNEIQLFLPFAPGKSRVLSIPSTASGHALWLNDVALTVVAGTANGAVGQPELSWDEKGFTLTLREVNLSGEGVAVDWQMWLAPARTEAEARGALLRHLADAADRLQEPLPSAPSDSDSPPLLQRLGARAEAALMADDAVEKRGVDRLTYRDLVSPAGKATARQTAGETVDTALAACALLGRFYQTGDDAMRRRARLLSNGLCAFQVSEEASPHWGAVWDAVRGKGKNTVYEDIYGGQTVSIATAARAAKGLQILQAHFDVEMYGRTALAATQWLILKMDRDGYIAAERFTSEGPPVEETNSPWIVGEALLPLVETFRVTGNEVFLKAALRAVRAFKEGLQESTLPFELATTEQLASAIEGVLLVSREYEKDDIVALARQLGLGLRARRLPSGALTEPPTVTPVSPLVPTLAGARAALALARVDDDPLWLNFAYRALHAASSEAAEIEASGSVVHLADQAAFLTLSTALLLAVAARANNCVADKDRITVTRGWQTFAPDPATRAYIKVYTPGPSGEELPVDYLALVCPVSLQVLISVLAPPTVGEVKIVKNSRMPFVKNLLTGDFDLQARLTPLGDGTEANIGVFLADT